MGITKLGKSKNYFNYKKCICACNFYGSHQEIVLNQYNAFQLYYKQYF